MRSSTRPINLIQSSVRPPHELARKVDPPWRRVLGDLTGWRRPRPGHAAGAGTESAKYPAPTTAGDCAADFDSGTRRGRVSAAGPRRPIGGSSDHRGSAWTTCDRYLRSACVIRSPKLRATSCLRLSTRSENCSALGSARAKGSVLDTSTVLLLPRLADPKRLPSEPLITATTLAELSVEPLVARSGQVRAARQAHVQRAESDFDPIPFDTAARPSLRASRSVTTTQWSQECRSRVRRHDRRHSPGEWVPLYTCNPEDFVGMDGLAVIAIPHPDAQATV